jgi:multidrug efflux pump subunit AcrA (membrane-fusion protein)/plastocyanin
MSTLQTLFNSRLAWAALALVAGALAGATLVRVAPDAPSGTPAGDAPAQAASAQASSGAAADSAASGLARYDENGDGIVYQGGMHPDVVRDQPGSCPICGMQLTPVSVGASRDEGTVRVSPATLQNIGVRTVPVRVAPLSRTVRTTGRFEADERRQTAVSPRVGGWVEALHADYQGARVEKGEPLFDLYSPELVATQEEYLSALRSAERLGAADSASRRLVASAERRLAYWGLTERQIERIAERGAPSRTVTFHAPAAGTVTEKRVTEGEKVAAGQTLLRITDLDPLWLMVDVYEQDLAWVREGTTARIDLPYAPGESVAGRVDHIYDTVDDDTRTVRARVTVPNPERSLKPGMYAAVRLVGGGTDAHPLVPEEAIVSSGEREVVIRALGEGRFQPVPVRTGLSAGGQVQVLRGLDEGARVVTRAQFLIDSEARLQGALGAMTSGGHDHGSSDPAPTDSAREDRAMKGRATEGTGRAGASPPGPAADTRRSADAERTVRVEITDGGFEPARIRLERGVRTRLAFTRTSAATCATSVQVPAFGVEKTPVPLGETVAVSFVPDAAGEAAFACGMDMVTGTLVVEEPS